ncbi:sodium-dependent transporter [Bacteroidota bacterium]
MTHIKNRENWGSRIGLIFAMAGFAVGFGNFLRFPVQAVQNGGGAFIIPYLVCFLLIGIPTLFVEWSVGRLGGKFGHHSSPFILQQLHKNPVWKYIGVFGIFTPVVIASYYTFLESWTLSYIFHSLFGSFHDKTQSEVINLFNSYISLKESTLFPFESIIFFIITIFINIYILSKGLRKGIERVAKIGVSLLIFFGIFLAIKAITIQEGVQGAINDGTVGLNYLWTPDYSSLWNPKVWLAAAGQIFFTIGIGWGTIQCYSSYLKENDDIVLSSMSAGWTNEFVEIVIGASLVIPLAVGYLGLEKMQDLANLGGLSLAFKTIPYLFSQWGPGWSEIAGFMWFGLLFLAGITSSLAMGSPFISFMEDEYQWTKKKSASVFGFIIFTLGLPTVLLFDYGVFDEYDYWTGTFCLFVFAMLEIILFSWFFGLNKGWKEITKGADIRIPVIFKFVLKYITPFMLIIVFLGSLVKPENSEWFDAFIRLLNGNGWILDNSSILKQTVNFGLKEQITATNDLNAQLFLRKKLWFGNATKIVLICVFGIFSILIYRASKKHSYNNKTL